MHPIDNIATGGLLLSLCDEPSAAGGKDAIDGAFQYASTVKSSHINPGDKMQ